ncbi:MAG: VOC family protein [Eubacterium sp.]|nr:VOC family protein [Candidatus Colimonas fimequi]
MNFKMYHNNITVLDIDRSLKFYEEALGFTEKRRINGEGFVIVFVGNDTTDYQLELTCYTERKEPWNLGDNEIHLGVRTDDIEAAHAHHEKMGCICFENPGMGIYFINDPDGYWTEIVPVR